MRIGHRLVLLAAPVFGVACLLFAHATPAWADCSEPPAVAVCPEFNGTMHNASEVPLTIFTDTITFDASDVLDKNHAIMTGSFGNIDGGPNAAGANILIGPFLEDAILLRQCTDLTVCSVSSWRVDINDLSFLTEMSNDVFTTFLFGVQTSAGTVHIGQTALTLTTVPEPGTLPLLGSALVIVGLRSRRR